MTAHAERAHAKLSPSASYRWMECPGSIRLSEGIPSTSSVFADEGTAAHELASHCLDHGYTPDRFLGSFIDINAKTDKQRFLKETNDGPRTFEVTEEMVEAVTTYCDYVRSLVSPGDELDVEFRFDLQHVVDGMFGTGDAVIYKPSTGALFVVDLKYGRGVLVDPKENPQLLSYGLGAVARHGNRPLSSITLVIVQPRCLGATLDANATDAEKALAAQGIRPWTADAITLMDFEVDLRNAAMATQAEDAPLKAGGHCKFCPAAGFCPANAKLASDIAGLEFAAEGVSPQAMTPEALSEALERAVIVESWVNRVRAFAHDQAVDGVVVPGWKLVAKRATRKWRGEDEIVGKLKIAFDLSDDDLFTRKIKSPAELEKVVPGKNKDVRAAAIAPYVTKESSGAVLVPASDKRPPIKSDGSEFGDAT